MSTCKLPLLHFVALTKSHDNEDLGPKTVTKILLRLITQMN